VVGLRGQICKFWTPFYKFGTSVPRNFKFGTEIDLGMSHLTDDKLVGSICVLNFMFLALSVTTLGRGVRKFKNLTQDPHHTPLGYFVIQNRHQWLIVLDFLDDDETISDAAC